MNENDVLERLRRLEIETPSWGYGNSGTRFHVYPWPGAARTVWERLDDAALVQQLTRACPSVALHVPWDRVDDGDAVGRYAAECGMRIGAVNTTLRVDTGHHPPGTNIEQIVAVLLEEGLLGGFHFNNRKYADDDLIVGSIDPFELFRIMREIARSKSSDRSALMIDQSHNVEGKIDAMIQSVV